MLFKNKLYDIWEIRLQLQTRALASVSDVFKFEWNEKNYVAKKPCRLNI